MVTPARDDENVDGSPSTSRCTMLKPLLLVLLAPALACAQSASAGGHDIKLLPNTPIEPLSLVENRGANGSIDVATTSIGGVATNTPVSPTRAPTTSTGATRRSTDPRRPVTQTAGPWTIEEPYNHYSKPGHLSSHNVSNRLSGTSGSRRLRRQIGAHPSWCADFTPSRFTTPSPCCSLRHGGGWGQARSRAESRAVAALIRARCVNAWGRLPASRPSGPISSLKIPVGLE